MYHVLDTGKDNDNDITVATVTAAAAATTMSPLGHGTAASSLHPGLIATINQSISPAFNQIVQNQTILQNQIAAMSMAQPPPTQAPANQYIVPPIPPIAYAGSNTTRPMDSDMDSKASSKEDVAVKTAEVMDAMAFAADANVVLCLRPRFAPRAVKDKWSSTKAIMGASLCHLIHMVE
jgi:hypothetical protein